jgi:hypothetical protein
MSRTARPGTVWKRATFNGEQAGTDRCSRTGIGVAAWAAAG